MKVTTIAGRSAGFRQPTDVTVDSHGDLFVLDVGNRCVRKIDATGAVSTFAGCSSLKLLAVPSKDGEGTEASFCRLQGLAMDTEDNIYVRDAGRIRKISPAGRVVTHKPGYGDDGFGIAIDRQGSIILPGDGYLDVISADDEEGRTIAFDIPVPGAGAVASDADGNVFVCGGTGRKRKILMVSRSGMVSKVTKLPGKAKSEWDDDEDDEDDGQVGFAFDGEGNLLIADGCHHCIRLLRPGEAGFMSVVAGKEGRAGFADGQGKSARFNTPVGVAVDGEGNLLVADSGNHSIRKVHAAVAAPAPSGPPPAAGLHRDMWTAYQSGLLTDVTFVVGDEAIAAHRTVLVLRSEHFAAMLTSEFLEARTSRIEVEGASPAAVRALLRYLYLNEVVVDEDAFLDVMELARRYQITPLYEECVRYCRRTLSLRTAIPWFIQSHALRFEDVQKLLFRYICKHFALIRIAARDTVELLGRHPELMLEVMLEVEC